MLGLTLVTVAGLVLLSVAAEHFVIGAARLAIRLRISAVVVGALLLGAGTSMPEIIASGLAAGRGQLDLAVGNVVGSNIANLTLVLGIASLVRPVIVQSRVLAREAPLAAAAVMLFALALLGGLTRIEGVLLIAGMAGASVLLLRLSRPGFPELESEVGEFTGETARHPLRVEIPRAVLGLGGTLAGAQLLVGGATGLAERLGVAEGFMGLTLVAVGTSLPELVTCIQAARRRESDLVVGNLLGSSIANSFAVGGVVALVGPGRVTDPHLDGVSAVVMVAFGLLGWLLMGTERRVVRWEGALLVAAYGGTIVLAAI